MFVGFQTFAFQTVGGAVAIPAPNGNRPRRDYTPTYYEIENHRRKMEAIKDSEQEAEIQLRSVQYKIDELEFKRLRNLADEAMQIELILLLREQFIINEALKDLQKQKELWRRQDDDLLILLMSLPFNA